MLKKLEELQRQLAEQHQISKRECVKLPTRRKGGNAHTRQLAATG